MNIDIELNKYISLLSFDEKKLIVDLIKNLKGNNKSESISKAILSNLELDRAFEKHKIRVSYYVDEKLIMIVRIRHTKQEPLQY